MSDFTVPDFAKDAAFVALFEASKKRFERRAAGEGEREIQATFDRKREVLKAELATLGAIIDERQIKATTLIEAYGKRYPKRVERNHPRKPSFFESLFSFGGASKMFAAASAALEDVKDGHTTRRRKEHEEEEIDKHLKRALAEHAASEAKPETAASRTAEFLKLPGNQEMRDRVEAIKAERVAYAARLARGDVPPDEQRERSLTERDIGPLEAPLEGVLIVGIETFGTVSHFLVRDLAGKRSWLPYDERLEPLFDVVIDVYRVRDAYEVKARLHPDGRPVSALDHFIAALKDDESARQQYRVQRSTMHAPRSLAPMPVTDADTKALVELLVAFVRTGGKAPASV